MDCGGCLGFLSQRAGHRHAPAGLQLGENDALSGPALRFLTANDVYRPDRLAQLSTLASQLVGPHVTKLVLAGDLLGGSIFAAGHRGESVVDVVNALGVDYCVLGNHEFDFGADRTRELMSKSRHPWLGSNVREATAAESGRPIFHTTLDMHIFEVPAGGTAGLVKVGVFGLCTPATVVLSDPGDGVVFESPVAHAQRCEAALQARGCELILALTHLSLAQDKDVVEACPGIRVVLGGHDHDPYLLVHKGALIVKCGENVDHVGVVDLHLHRAGPNAPLETNYSFRLLTIHGIPADPAVTAAAQPWQAALHLAGEDPEEPLCCVSEHPVSTKSQDLRTHEVAFACMVADAIKWSYRADGCEAAVQNGGFVRSSRLYPALSLITAAQIREEMPFDRSAMLLSITGEDLRRGLEEMLKEAPLASGSFPHLSAGLRAEYDPDGPALGKVRTVEVGGAGLEPEREYLVAISSFYVDCEGDGVTAFRRGRQDLLYIVQELLCTAEM